MITLRQKRVLLDTNVLHLVKKLQLKKYYGIKKFEPVAAEAQQRERRPAWKNLKELTPVSPDRQLGAAMFGHMKFGTTPFGDPGLFARARGQLSHLMFGKSPDKLSKNADQVDVEILATALSRKIEIVVSNNTKDFGKQVVKEYARKHGTEIMTEAEFSAWLKSED